jgi:hypothetical protein
MDPVLGRMAGEGMAKTRALVFGRRTYEDFSSFWPNSVPGRSAAHCGRAAAPPPRRSGDRMPEP